MATAAQVFDLSRCQMPGSADHHHQRQQLLSGLHAKGVSLSVFNAFMHNALAACAARGDMPVSCLKAGLSGWMHKLAKKRMHQR